MKNRLNQSGQALLLVLLAMTAIVTVVLSVASRSVSDIAVTSNEEDALRAFSAAEAGVEKALLSNQAFAVPVSVDPSGDTSVKFTSTITSNSNGSEFIYPGYLKTGESATFWLTERGMDGSYKCTGGTCYNANRISKICWGVNGPYPSGKEPALLLGVYYDFDSGTNSVGNLISSGGTDFSKIKVIKHGYDPKASRISAINGNNFTLASNTSCVVGNTTFTYSVSNINLNSADLGLPPVGRCANRPGCLIMFRAMILYSDPAKPEQVAITVPGGGAGANLPAQGSKIESTGVAGTSTRKVNVFQGYPEFPSIFDGSVFSLSNFSK